MLVSYIILVRSESAELAKQQSVFHRNPNVYVCKALKHKYTINACKKIGMYCTSLAWNSLTLTPGQDNGNWLKTWITAHHSLWISCHMRMWLVILIGSNSDPTVRWNHEQCRQEAILEQKHKAVDTWYQSMCILKRAQRENREITKHKRGWWEALGAETVSSPQKWSRLKAATAEMHQLCTT